MAAACLARLAPCNRVYRDDAAPRGYTQAMPSRLPESVIELLQAMVRVDTVNSALTGKPEAEAELVELLATFAGKWMLEVELLPVQGQADQLLLTLRTGPFEERRTFKNGRG